MVRLLDVTPLFYGKQPIPASLKRYNEFVTLNAPFDRITIEPGKLGGKPCIRGLRISVENVLNILASYSDRKELFENYPDLEEEDLRQALAFAATSLDVIGR